MTERTVDARGLLCPKPLMLVKQALEQIEAGHALRVLLDNDIACANVERFLADNGAEPRAARSGGEITVLATKARGGLARLDAAAYCAPAAAARPGPYVLVFASDRMGRGSDELGAILIQACVNALPEASPRPDAVIFYNAGVRLAAEGSPVLDALRALAAGGSRLLVCGTCLNYYQLKDALRVGVISNMFEILELLAAAGKVVYP